MTNLLQVLFSVTVCLAFCHGSVIQDVSLTKAQQRFVQYTKYYAYNRENLYRGVEIKPTAEDINKAVEDKLILPGPDVETVVIIHGQSSNATDVDIEAIKEAYLWIKDYNVIMVDWTIVAAQNYDSAFSLVPIIASGVGEFLNLLTAAAEGETPAVDYDNLHLIGFGLGAHLAGAAVRDLPKKVQIITGLDPAGPRWDTNSGRLSRTDARYVEVIHTDGFGNNAKGIEEPIGHVDFYPNGGRDRQIGCRSQLCSHRRALEYFASSVRSGEDNGLIGKYCTNMRQMTQNQCNGRTVEMGGSGGQKFTSGIFRLNTKGTYPFY